MADAPIGFQLHALVAFGLFALWPFTRLVHVFTRRSATSPGPTSSTARATTGRGQRRPAPRLGPGRLTSCATTAAAGIDAVLARLDVTSAEDQARLRHEVDELRIHISKEEDGIFPVTLVELSGPEWDAAIAAWERAHPGRTLDLD